MTIRPFIAILLLGSAAIAAAQERKPVPADMALIPAGTYRPLFRGEADPVEVPVRAYLLEKHPVTNGDFLAFVKANPRWRRSQAKRIFADASYLQHWAGDLDLGTNALASSQPVTSISWFAAKAYASWKGRRLPATAEWELAASAGFTTAIGTNDVAFTRAVARWYATPSPEVLPAVGISRASVHGVFDLHGLVWEWTSDFNSSLVTGDARGDTGLERQLFCGAGSLGARERTDFPAFMRAGFRSSLKAGYTVSSLGFRCAQDP